MQWHFAGIVYEFKNNKIVSFRDSFKYMGNLPFTVYFDFETTTGDNVVDDPKLFVISYCQIYAFHFDLNRERIVIFSFQPNPEEYNSLDHFSQDHVRFYDLVTVTQMRDATMGVLVKEKTNLLSELFLVELKLTIDTLVKWFNNTFKAKFLELNDIWKQIFVEENPTDFSKTICSICGFKLFVSNREGPKNPLNLTTWYNFMVQQEYLFLKNIFSAEDLSRMDNLKTLENFYDVFKVF